MCILLFYSALTSSPRMMSQKSFFAVKSFSTCTEKPVDLIIIEHWVCESCSLVLWTVFARIIFVDVLLDGYRAAYRLYGK